MPIGEGQFFIYGRIGAAQDRAVKVIRTLERDLSVIQADIFGDNVCNEMIKVKHREEGSENALYVAFGNAAVIGCLKVRRKTVKPLPYRIIDLGDILLVSIQ